MRAVSMRHTVVPSAEREAFHRQATASRAHYSSSGCRYWLYQEDGLPGAYVEFFEAPDKETLQRAQRAAGPAATTTSRLYIEVELT